jgi:hypothetical protein
MCASEISLRMSLTRHRANSRWISLGIDTQTGGQTDGYIRQRRPDRRCRLSSALSMNAAENMLRMIP